MPRRGHNTVPTAIMESNGYLKVPGKEYNGFQVFWHAHTCRPCMLRGLDCQIPAPGYGQRTDKTKIRVRNCIQCLRQRQVCSSSERTVSLDGGGTDGKRKLEEVQRRVAGKVSDQGSGGSGASSPEGSDVPLSRKRKRARPSVTCATTVAANTETAAQEPINGLASKADAVPQTGDSRGPVPETGARNVEGAQQIEPKEVDQSTEDERLPEVAVIATAQPATLLELPVVQGDAVSAIVALGDLTLAMDKHGGVGLVLSEHLDLACTVAKVESWDDVCAACNTAAHVQLRDDRYFRLELELAQAASLRGKLPKLRKRLERGFVKGGGADNGGDARERVELRAALAAKAAEIRELEAVTTANLDDRVAALERQARAAEEKGTQLAATAKAEAEEMTAEIRQLRTALGMVYGIGFKQEKASVRG